MVEIKVQASDSASAMEEVEKRLGSDALIVSTTKVDGKIEIVATNDEPSKYQKPSDPLILDSEYRISNFSDILGGQIEKTNKKNFKSSDLAQRTLFDESIQSIKSEIKKLEDLSYRDQQTQQDSEKKAVPDLFMFAGISKNLVDLLSKDSNENNVENMAKTIAKKLVNGQCPHFETSDVILIIGAPFSGKSVFSKKLVDLMQKREEVKECKLLDSDNDKGILNKVNSWAANIGGNEKQPERMVIAELRDAANVERALLAINKYNPKLKVSIINVCEVGKSYQWLKGNLAKRTLENEYLAITKLDLCDLSLAEISAFIELDHKCMFFSGIETETDGLFFAQVDKVKSHLIQTIENEEYL